jgi:hypothetical protein
MFDRLPVPQDIHSSAPGLCQQARETKAHSTQPAIIVKKTMLCRDRLEQHMCPLQSCMQLLLACRNVVPTSAAALFRAANPKPLLLEACLHPASALHNC